MKYIFKKFLVTGVVLICCGTVFSQTSTNGEGIQEVLYTPKQQELRITADNVRIFSDKENGGYHIFVKKLPKVNSILLTETTKDPAGKNDSYAYRAKEYNSINGDEIRYLDGKPLVSEGAKYSLVDSTVEKTDFFDEAFHIYVPEKLVYGYEWSRNGEITLGKGTFINIRSFEKPYADYSGDYMDSPFMFDLVVKKRIIKKEKPVPVVEEKPLEEPEVFEETESVDELETILTDNYNPVASEKLKEISEEIIYSKGPETIISDIHSLLEGIEDKDNLDVVFAIDTTGSMKNDLEKLKAELIPELIKLFGEETQTRIGLLFYRDYGDSYKYMDLPVKCYNFTSNFSLFKKNLNSVKILGKEGGDVPEAVYEAIYAATEFYSWRPFSKRKIILIGDAEPHPTPRGTKKYSKDYVMGLAKEKNVQVYSILLPKD